MMGWNWFGCCDCCPSPKSCLRIHLIFVINMKKNLILPSGMFPTLRFVFGSGTCSTLSLLPQGYRLSKTLADYLIIAIITISTPLAWSDFRILLSKFQK